jgi:hypothetical protein
MSHSRLNLVSAGVSLAQTALARAHCFALWLVSSRQTQDKSSSPHTVQWLGTSRKNQNVELMNQCVHILRAAPESPPRLMLSTPLLLPWQLVMLMPEMHIQLRSTHG